jgi:hypothetical protein
MRNGPSIKVILNLPFQSDVRVWREKDRWIGLFKFLVTDGETCTIDMSYKPTNFRSIVVKLYYILSLPEISQEKKEIEDIESPDDDRDELIDAEKQPVMKHFMIVIH